VISAKQLLQLVLIAIGGSAYLGLGYLATVSEHPPLVALIVGLIPLAVLAFIAAWNSRSRALALLLLAGCTLGLGLNLDLLRDHVAWLYFVQHAGAMALLAITFGSTLGRGDAGALCSSIASFVSPTRLDEDYLHYTWKVTLVWTVFFVVSALLSVLLFFWGPIEVWSFFANLLTPILLGAMFAGEYMIRLRTMPGRVHFSIVATIQAYREYSRR
jgi:uncharacterized membrane protein